MTLASIDDKNSIINCCRSSSSATSSSRVSINESVSRSNNNTTFHTENNDMKLDVNSPERKLIDIEFNNIKYKVRKFAFSKKKFVTKEILHGISGTFRSGELTAIMGPSGSGKSTLLNVLSGYISTGVTGTVYVNGKITSTSSEKYRRLSCYIHQNDLLRSMLTVSEIMLIAAHLKLGFNVTKVYKINVIKQILLLLGLEKRYHAYTGRLSGGQKKRLAIALELISNPSVLYLDEPTTGLDSSSCIQCVSLLKRLAQEGHTVVCTIHQPSALLFELFNKLYTVAEGNCIYQGSVRELVPYLNDFGLHCPSYHNPADYMLEIAVGEHERDLTLMINAASKKYYENSDLHQLNQVGKIISQDTNESNSVKAIDSKTKHKYSVLPISEKYLEDKTEIKNMKSKIKPASPIMQYILLLNRNFTCSRRKYFLLLARILCHVIIGFVFGYIYLNVGPNAKAVLGNYVYIYGTILLIVYTGKMSVVLSFPLELDMLRREHFNRWYKLGPYFLSVISFEIPFQIICVCLYIVISFYLTGNFYQDFRFYYFLMMGILASLSAQAWGFFIGATLPVKLAVFAGPILAVVFSIFGFCTRYIDITPLLRWMWHLSYFRAGFHGALNAVYGMNRTFLNCPDTEKYCHFRSPRTFLSQMMISDVNMKDSIILMSSIMLVMHILTIIILWYKLNKR